ncbi:MAG: hypothetical protein GYA21_06525 [Myxococcales bacterium]|nr:hypothetical protein [Myxococcales bacterium]
MRLLLACGMAWLATMELGCYPESDAGLSLVELPLGHLGIEVDAPAVENWGRYATKTQALPYELDPQQRKFFLQLALRAEDGLAVNASLASVSYYEQNALLTLGLVMDTCHRCRFTAAIFLGAAEGKVETYTGETDWFDSEKISSPIPVSAWIHPVGSLRCLLSDGTIQWLALRDIQADLRFPRIAPSQTAGGGYEALLPWLPVGRRTAVDLSVNDQVQAAVLRDSTQLESTEVNLDVAGQELVFYCAVDSGRP